MIDVLPLQKAVLEYIDNGHTWSEICKRLGWMRIPPKSQRKGLKADTKRLKRSLGIIESQTSQTRGGEHRIYRYKSKFIGIKIALKIIDAIDRDPVEFDL